MRRNSVISGTAILIAAGFITRILGFVFRIYLSGLMGSEGMGLYQLLTPVYFLAFSICASGTQMAISRLASYASTHRSNGSGRSILYAGLLISLSLCFLITILLYTKSQWFAERMLMEPRLAGPLRILSLALPWAVGGACIKSYFFSLQRMDVPAVDQLLEQLARMGTIFFLAPILSDGSLIDLCYMAVIGNVIGDFISCLYCAIFYLRDCHRFPGNSSGITIRASIPRLLAIALPLSANRVISQLLSGFENIMLPTTLQSYGLTSSEALSTYGEYTGMAMPILFFPCVITNALSTNLLPVIARADAAKNTSMIQKAIRQSVAYTLYIGFLFTAVLYTCGDTIGFLLYQNHNAGQYITWLSLLCPFFYLESTFGGLMNGLGLHHHSFIHSLICDSLRIAAMLTLVPIYGIIAFYGAMAVSLLICTLLNLRCLCRTAKLPFKPLAILSIPALASIASILLTKMTHPITGHTFQVLVIHAGVSSIIYASILACADPQARKFITKRIFR